ncbi:MAG: PAN domain-containing protein [Myxococcaceae bacterium]
MNHRKARGLLLLLAVAGIASSVFDQVARAQGQATFGTSAVTIVTTKSCSDDPNDKVEPYPSVFVQIGTHTVQTDKSGTAKLQVPPGEYAVTADDLQDPHERFGWVAPAGIVMRIPPPESGLAKVNVTAAQEHWEVRLLTCDPSGLPRARATIQEGGRITITRKGQRLDGYLGAPLRDGDELSIIGNAKLTWLEGGTVVVEQSGKEVTHLKIGPIQPMSSLGPRPQSWAESSIRVVKGIITFFLPHDEGKKKTRGKFTVTDGTVSTIKGTHFSFANDDQSKVVTITVYEGSLEVVPLNPALAPFDLNAGAQVQVSPDRVGPIQAAPSAPPPPALAKATLPPATATPPSATPTPPPATSTPPPATPTPPPATATPTPATPTPPPATPTPPTATATAPPTAGFEYDIDRPGSDILNFEFEDGDVAQNAAACAAACQNEQRCRAWTYVRPGVQGPKSRCWLKDAVPAPVPNATFAVSGVVRPDGAAPSGAALGGAGQAGTATPAGCNGFTGKWSDNIFGQMVLKQDGARVTGSYEGTVLPGTIEGTVTGRALDANWVSSEGHTGTVHLELAGDGSTYKGEAATVGWGNQVNGQCVGAAPPS